MIWTLLLTLAVFEVAITDYAIASRPGGMSDPKPATNEVQRMLNQVRSAVEAEHSSRFEKFEAVEYATQLVSGINYFVKVAVSDDAYIHVRFHRTFSGQITYHSYQDGKTREDNLDYF